MKLSKTSVMISLAFVVLLLFAVVPASADVLSYSPVKDQARSILIDQISGIPMTNDQYLRTVWPEVYEKISPVNAAKLATVSKVWTMTEGERIDGNLLITSAHDGPEKSAERYALIESLDGLDISIGEYMQIVWPEFYTEMNPKSRQAVSITVRQSPTHTVESFAQETTRASLSVNTQTSLWQDRQFLKYNGLSRAYNVIPDYHYIEVYLRDTADQNVNHAAYAKQKIHYSESEYDQMLTVPTENMVAWPTNGDYHTYARSFATLGAVTVEGVPVTGGPITFQWS